MPIAICKRQSTSNFWVRVWQNLVPVSLLSLPVPCRCSSALQKLFHFEEHHSQTFIAIRTLGQRKMTHLQAAKSGRLLLNAKKRRMISFQIHPLGFMEKIEKFVLSKAGQVPGQGPGRMLPPSVGCATLVGHMKGEVRSRSVRRAKNIALFGIYVSMIFENFVSMISLLLCLKKVAKKAEISGVCSRWGSKTLSKVAKNSLALG